MKPRKSMSKCRLINYIYYCKLNMLKKHRDSHMRQIFGKKTNNSVVDSLNPKIGMKFQRKQIDER